MGNDLTIRPFKPDTPNWKVLQAVRNTGSEEYRSRIPAATQADISATMKALDKYNGQWNEFVSAIINKVGLTIAKNRNWTNPLAKFKRGELQWGDTIEEIQTGLVQAYVYDHDQDYGERANWGRERPEVQASYHTINRENFYKITVDEIALRRAFLSPTGLADFINQLMDAPTTSDNWDEYLAMRQLFAEYEENGGFFYVNIPEIPVDGEGSVEARQALRKIKTYSGKLRFLSRNYNAAKMPVHAEQADLELFTTPEFQADIDVEALAPLLNVSYAEISTRITVIDEFPAGMEGVKAVLTTSDFFVVADTFYDTRQAANAAGLIENWFLHHHQILSVSRFVPAIAFTTGPGTVIERENTPVSGIGDLAVIDVDGAAVSVVERGHSYEFTGSAITTPEGGVNTAIRLSLIGAESSHSYITNSGVLHVAIDDSSDEITIRAVSVDDDTFTKDLTIAVRGDLLNLWPNPSVIEGDDTTVKVVVPLAPTAGESNNVIIPTVTGVQYKLNGTNVTNGSSQGLEAGSNTVTAEARPGFALQDGATASWDFTGEPS